MMEKHIFERHRPYLDKVHRAGPVEDLLQVNACVLHRNTDPVLLSPDTFYERQSL